MTIASVDQYREKLSEYAWTLFFWGFWGETDISDVEAIRREFERRIAFCSWALRELEDWVNKSGVRLVHENDKPTLESRNGISSPIKTEELRLFEDQVRKVFGLDETALATTQWPEAESPHIGVPVHNVQRQLQGAIDDIFRTILTPAKDAAD